MKFNLISSDPPWAFGDRLQKMKSSTKRSAQSQYSTLTASEVAALDVPSIADPQYCLLALWVPSVLLPEGFEVMKAWGFNYKQTFIWVKTKKNLTKHVKKLIDAGKEVDVNELMAFGMGRLFRQSHEIALIGTMGKVYTHLQNKSQRSVMFDINRGHSTKPELLQDRLDRMFPEAKKLEMFGRRLRSNWTVIGDGVTGVDVRESIANLKDLSQDEFTAFNSADACTGVEF